MPGVAVLGGDDVAGVEQGGRDVEIAREYHAAPRGGERGDGRGECGQQGEAEVVAGLVATRGRNVQVEQREAAMVGSHNTALLRDLRMVL